jgi:hypothetical protein
MRAPPQADCVKADRAVEVPPLCFTVTGFNRDRAKATLTALGVQNLRPLNSNSVHMDDPVGYDVQGCGNLSGLGHQPGRLRFNLGSHLPDHFLQEISFVSGRPAKEQVGRSLSRFTLRDVRSARQRVLSRLSRARHFCVCLKYLKSGGA